MAGKQIGDGGATRAPHAQASSRPRRDSASSDVSIPRPPRLAARKQREQEADAGGNRQRGHRLLAHALHQLRFDVLGVGAQVPRTPPRPGRGAARRPRPPRAWQRRSHDRRWSANCLASFSRSSFNCLMSASRSGTDLVPFPAFAVAGSGHCITPCVCSASTPDFAPRFRREPTDMKGRFQPRVQPEIFMSNRIAKKAPIVRLPPKSNVELLLARGAQVAAIVMGLIAAIFALGGRRIHPGARQPRHRASA